MTKNGVISIEHGGYERRGEREILYAIKSAHAFLKPGVEDFSSPHYIAQPVRRNDNFYI